LGYIPGQAWKTDTRLFWGISQGEKVAKDNSYEYLSEDMKKWHNTILGNIPGLSWKTGNRILPARIIVQVW